MEGGISRFFLWLNRLGHGRIHVSLHLAVTSRVATLVCHETSSFKSETGFSDRDGVSCADRGYVASPDCWNTLAVRPALCMTSDRSLGRVWHKVLGQLQVQVLLGDSLLSGDATWALSGLRFNLLDGRGYVAPRIGSLVPKGDARICSLPENLGDVGVVWEHRLGNETAWATPRHECLCSLACGYGAILPQANPSVFTEAVNL